MRPYFRVPRDFLRESPLWIVKRRKRTPAEAMIDIFSMAVYTADYPYATPHGTDVLQKDEFVASIRFLAERWKWSKDTVSRFVKCAEKARHLTRQRQGRNGTIYRLATAGFESEARAESRTQAATETSTETRTQIGQIKEGGEKGQLHRRAAKRVLDYSAQFSEVWSRYPARSGSNPKDKAAAQFEARLAEGVPFDVLRAKTLEYRAWAEAKKKIGTETVMQAARFYGASREYENGNWALPASVDRAQQARRRGYV